MADNVEREAEIISLDEFKRRIQTPNPDTELSSIISPEYVNRALKYTTDYQSQQAISRMLDYLNAERPKNVVVLSRFVMTHTAKVSMHLKSNGWYFAVEKNYGELEEITADLENIPEMQARRLGFPILDRFYSASLIAQKIIDSQEHLDPVALEELPHPEIGPGNPFNTKDTQQIKEIRLWQASAGLGLLAVTHEQPKKYARLHSYLHGVLDHRFHYAQALRGFEDDLGIKIFGLGPPDGDEISDRLIGICNPLSMYQLKYVLKTYEPKPGE